MGRSIILGCNISIPHLPLLSGVSVQICSYAVPGDTGSEETPRSGGDERGEGWRSGTQRVVGQAPALASSAPG